MRGNYAKVKSIILRLYQEDDIKNKITIVGGTVPYLVSKMESVREHSDIDIIVKQEDMPFIREYLKREHLSVSDSLNLSCNKLHIDHGVDAVIDGIMVNFAPYDLIGDRIIQRNFLRRQNSGMDALVTVVMEHIDVDHVFIETFVDGTMIHTYSMEMVKIMKEKSKKKKDSVDIKVIDDFGYGEHIYSILKEQLKDMKFTIEPGNRLLKFLIDLNRLFGKEDF